MEERSLPTINGRVTVRRRRWRLPDQTSVHPLDAVIGLAEAVVSLGVLEMACRMAHDGRNFDKSAKDLERTAQVKLSGETVRQVVEDEGREVSAAAESRELGAGWKAADCKLPDDSTRVYLGADGVKAPMVTQAEKDQRRRKVEAKRRNQVRREKARAKRRAKAEAAAKAQAAGKARAAEKAKAKRRSKAGEKAEAIRAAEAGEKLEAVRPPRPLPTPKPGADQRYKEFKVVTYYDQTQEHRLVSVTRGDCEVAGRLMRRDAGRIGLSAADDKVANVDGADWIRNQIQRQCLYLDAVGLDFYHLAENVHKWRRCVFDEHDAPDADPLDPEKRDDLDRAEKQDTPGKKWAAEVLHVAKHQGYEPLLDRLTTFKATLHSRRKRAALQRLIDYVTDRREMIRYPEFLAKGRQIGSGPTESMCKTTTARLKGPGMRWDADNAEAMMSLAALWYSGQWELWWKTRLLRKAG